MILEHSLPTTPKGILQVSSGIPRSRIALETGTHSPWVSRQLTQLGHEVIVAWVLSEAKDIVPIPGTKRVRYLEENMGALDVTLTENDPKNIAERLALIQVIGERYAPDLMALSDRA